MRADVSAPSSPSRRAWVLAAFTAIAMIFGGGGSPNPATELLLQLLFCGLAVIWLWVPTNSLVGSPGRAWIVWLLAAVPLVIPIVQLIPLPPSVWTALPGRGNESAALALVSETSSWRPISMSPSRTMAGLLATIPAVFCLLAVSRLGKRDRRLVLAAIVLIAAASALLGAAQLAGRGHAFNFYERFSRGWVTGFQANRNAEADILLIGLLALAASAAPYFVGPPGDRSSKVSQRTVAFAAAAAAVLFLVAIVMTGSRAGISITIVACVTAAAIVDAARPPGDARTRWRNWLMPVLAVVTLVSVGGGAIYSGNAQIERVAERFSDLENSRAEVWADTRFAMAQAWPVGVGLGGFVPAFFAAERLETVDSTVPNRAHNDYLELGLEAGALGYVVLLAGVVLCMVAARRTWREDPEARSMVLFGLGVLILLALHSLVDYPLRSMAVACLAGIAGGMLTKPVGVSGDDGSTLVRTRRKRI